MAKNSYTVRVAGGKKVALSKIDTSFTAGLDKAAAPKELEALRAELERLQELLFAAHTHSLLIVLQGMDTSGKDGAIRGALGGFNPQGCRVETFKVPTAEELGHDFLWRVHKVTPVLGQVTIFNRSHYEDVLVVRVHNLVEQKVWQKRYDHINRFEELLTDSNTIVVKFFLHISKQEQEERLLAREADTEKAWKLSVGDWQQREYWSDYQRAYEDALTQCSTNHAPWHVVPADKKWFRNVAIAKTLVEMLSSYESCWKKKLAMESKARLAELKAYREQK